MILRKIIENPATRYHILKLKCTKFDFGCGLPQAPLGELTAFPQADQLDLRGLLLREGRMGRKGKGGERERKGMEGRTGEEDGEGLRHGC